MRRTLPLFLLLGACGQGKVTPPSLDSVTPADTASGLVTPLQVDGRDFSASATIVLRQSDQEVVVDTTVLDGGTRATGVLPAGLSAGVWDVVVRNGRRAAGIVIFVDRICVRRRKRQCAPERHAGRAVGETAASIYVRVVRRVRVSDVYVVCLKLVLHAGDNRLRRPEGGE